MMRRRRCMWVILAVVGPGLATAMPNLEVEVLPRSVTVGDSVEVLLDVPLAVDGSSPELPSDFASWGLAEVVNAGRLTPSATDAPASDPGAVAVEGGASSATATAPESVRFRIELRAFRTGRVLLPPLSFEVPRQDQVELAEDPWTTPPDLYFDVESVLPSDLESDQALEPRPLAPPRPLPRRHLDRWLLATLAGSAALLALLFWRRRSLLPNGTRDPRVPPLDQLRRELERLAEIDATETVHVGLSRALRLYLQEAAALPALERTTAEILSELRTSPLSADVSHRLIKLLRHCDGVKFALHEVPDGEMRRRLQEARSLGEAVEAELTLLRNPSEVEAA